MSVKTFIFSLLVLGIVSLTYMYNSNNLLPFTENVLANGMTITAYTPTEKLVIEGKKGTRRAFKGKGWSTTANLTPRPTRWYGSLGLYDPADSYTQDGRLLINEGRQFFSNEDEVLHYICHFKRISNTVIYNNSGLIIAYKITSLKSGAVVRYIHIWQVYIHGEKPTSLKGADDHVIVLSGGTTSDTATPHEAEMGEARQMCSEQEFKDRAYFKSL